MEATFFSEGRVDAILLWSEGAAGFFDGGYHRNGISSIKKMRDNKVESLEWCVFTHAHKNHIGGAAAIIDALNPKTVYIPHDKVRQRIIAYAEGKAEKAAAENAHYEIVGPGKRFLLGNTVFDVLGPLRVRSVKPWLLSENLNSLVIRATTEYNKRVILTGDTSEAILRAIDKKWPGSIRCDYLKNPHHNGRLSADILRALRPALTAICNSAPPSKAYARLLAAVGSKVKTACPVHHGGDGNFTIMLE